MMNAEDITHIDFVGTSALPVVIAISDPTGNSLLKSLQSRRASLPVGVLGSFRQASMTCAVEFVAVEFRDVGCWLCITASEMLKNVVLLSRLDAVRAKKPSDFILI